MPFKQKARGGGERGKEKKTGSEQEKGTQKFASQIDLIEDQGFEGRARKQKNGNKHLWH